MIESLVSFVYGLVLPCTFSRLVTAVASMLYTLGSCCHLSCIHVALCAH